MKVIRESLSAMVAGAVSAMAGCATLFLSFWGLGALIEIALPRALEAQGVGADGGPLWTHILPLGSLVCAAVVARYVWRRLYQGHPGDRSADGTSRAKLAVGGHGPAGRGDTAGRGASSRIGAALRWAFFSTLLAFSVMFFTPLVIGGPGGSLAPIVALIYTPIVFTVTLVLALMSPRLAVVTIVASLLYPVWYYAKSPPRQPGGTLLPLNAEERALIRSKHFALRLAVDRGQFPPVYREALIRDLGQIGLFAEVGQIETIRSPDLIATVTGGYYGDVTGHSFSLHWAGQPERKVNVKVWHDVRLFPGTRRGGTRRLELEQLAQETIRQMDALGSARPSDTRNQ